MTGGPTLFQHSCVAIDRQGLDMTVDNSLLVFYGGTENGEPSSTAHTYSFRDGTWSVLFTGLNRPLVAGCLFYDTATTRFLQFGGMFGSRIFMTLSMFTGAYTFVAPSVGVFGSNSYTSCVTVPPAVDGQPLLVLSTSNGDSDGMLHRIALRATPCSQALNEVPTDLGDHCIVCPSGAVADGDTCRSCNSPMLTFNPFLNDWCADPDLANRNQVLRLIALITPIAVSMAVATTGLIYLCCCRGVIAGGGPSFDGRPTPQRNERGVLCFITRHTNRQPTGK